MRKFFLVGTVNNSQQYFDVSNFSIRVLFLVYAIVQYGRAYICIRWTRVGSWRAPEYECNELRGFQPNEFIKEYQTMVNILPWKKSMIRESFCPQMWPQAVLRWLCWRITQTYYNTTMIITSIQANSETAKAINQSCFPLCFTSQTLETS